MGNSFWPNQRTQEGWSPGQPLLSNWSMKLATPKAIFFPMWFVTFPMSNWRSYKIQERRAECWWLGPWEGLPLISSRLQSLWKFKFLLDFGFVWTQVSATYLDGYRATSVCSIIGPRAVEKAEKTANAILKKWISYNCFVDKWDESAALSVEQEGCLRRWISLTMTKLTYMWENSSFYVIALHKFLSNPQVIGSEASYGAKQRGVSPREVMMWLSVRHRYKKALAMFSKEIAHAGTGMAPGFTNMAGGRPRV